MPITGAKSSDLSWSSRLWFTLTAWFSMNDQLVFVRPKWLWSENQSENLYMPAQTKAHRPTLSTLPDSLTLSVLISSSTLNYNWTCHVSHTTVSLSTNWGYGRFPLFWVFQSFWFPPYTSFTQCQLHCWLTHRMKLNFLPKNRNPTLLCTWIERATDNWTFRKSLPASSQSSTDLQQSTN